MSSGLDKKSGYLRKDVGLFAVIALLIAFQCYKLIFKPKIEEENRAKKLTEIASGLTLNSTYLTVDGVEYYSDSFKFYYSVDDSYLKGKNRDDARVEIENQMKSAVCDLFERLNADSDFTIVIVVRQFFENYYMAKHC